MIRKKERRVSKEEGSMPSIQRHLGITGRWDRFCRGTATWTASTVVHRRGAREAVSGVDAPTIIEKRGPSGGMFGKDGTQKGMVS